MLNFKTMPDPKETPPPKSTSSGGKKAKISVTETSTQETTKKVV